MRVISGRWKGRKLVSFEAGNIRPTTDRVKESLFNIISFRLPESRVLDLFSGTGSLGIEALSRGAQTVCSVENHPKSLKIIKENHAALDIKSEILVLPVDVFKFLKDYDGQPFDLILIDPPFTQKLGHDVMLKLSQSKVFGEHSLIIIETARKERLDENYEPLVQTDQRLFGDKILSFFSCATNLGAIKP